MNLPNKMTMGRLLLTVAFLVAIFWKFHFHETVALVLFCLGGLTDHLDGRIARKYNLVTAFGKLMDPLADKIFTCSAFIAFVENGRMAAWMVVIIVMRELAITGLRTLAASQQVVLAAERLGKHKTVSQIVCIIAILVAMSYQQWGGFGQTMFGFPIYGSKPWIELFAEVMKWVAVFMTIVSGTFYLWRNRRFFVNDL